MKADARLVGVAAPADTGGGAVPALTVGSVWAHDRAPKAPTVAESEPSLSPVETAIVFAMREARRLRSDRGVASPSVGKISAFNRLSEAAR
jgi:hypothetical protein